MSYQYCFCPACGTRRAAYDYRCSVCGGLVPRTPVSVRTGHGFERMLLKWRRTVRAEAALGQPQTPAA